MLHWIPLGNTILTWKEYFDNLIAIGARPSESLLSHSMHLLLCLLRCLGGAEGRVLVLLT